MSTILLIWILVIVLVYHSSSQEIDEIYDASLASYARVLSSLMIHEALEEKNYRDQFQLLVNELGVETIQKSEILSTIMRKLQSSSSANDYLSLSDTESVIGHPYESKIAFLVSASDGTIMLRSTTEVSLPDDIDGYVTRGINGDTWRMFGLTHTKAGIKVIVGENIEIRTELQREILANGLWPFLVLLPVIMLAILGAISKGLLPLQTVTSRVSSRSPNSLTPLSTDGAPIEIQPLIEALNDLFKRVETVLDNERRFTANAAHELRTPLAAIKTHAQVLQMNASPDMKLEIDRVIHGIDRASHMVQQLLTLARAEIKAHEDMALTSIDLMQLIRKVMLDFSSAALDKQIELSLLNEKDHIKVQSDEGLLHIVIQNLLDNAVRYTPEGGSINVSIDIDKDTVRLYIEDSGPGIDPDMRDMMFEYFQRGEAEDQQGVGLGLSIVNQIVQLLKTDLSLDKSESLGGLKATLVLHKSNP